MTKLTPAQARIVEALKAGATLHSGHLGDGDYLRFADGSTQTVRSNVFDALVRAGAVKRVGHIWARTWTAA